MALLSSPTISAAFRDDQLSLLKRARSDDHDDDDEARRDSMASSLLTESTIVEPDSTESAEEEVDEEEVAQEGAGEEEPADETGLEAQASKIASDSFDRVHHLLTSYSDDSARRIQESLLPNLLHAIKPLAERVIEKARAVQELETCNGKVREFLDQAVQAVQAVQSVGLALE